MISVYNFGSCLPIIAYSPFEIIVTSKICFYFISYNYFATLFKDAMTFSSAGDVFCVDFLFYKPRVF